MCIRDRDTTTRLLKALYAAPHGVYAMSQDIPVLVETSTNLASVKMKPNHVERERYFSTESVQIPNRGAE